MIFSRLSEDGSIHEDGGKGYNLKRLISKGYNVPDGIVIRASFYRDNYPVYPAFDFDNDTLLEKQCREMRNSVLAREFDQSAKKLILEELKRFGEGKRFAVRSSSPFEDLSSAAFAGQHDTFLNVDLNDVPGKARECFASLWLKHAVLYRHHNGFDQESASMAVVVQVMVDSDISGVAFSVDPVGGNLGHVLIESNFGVGESVVSGESLTDSWIVDMQKKEILERRIGRKETKVTLANTGGTRVEALSSDKQESPSLDDAKIFSIAEMVKKIESTFGAPQDVEWAYTGNDLHILQARPQTSIPPRFTRDESAERFPEPLTPLTWSYVDEAFNISLDHSLKLMGISLPTRPWFYCSDGYVYGNQNAVQLLGLYRPVDMSSMEAIRKHIAEIRERFQWVIDLPHQWLRDLDRYLLEMGRLSSVIFDKFDIEDFQKYFQSLFKVSCDYFKPNIAISMTQSFLTRTLFEYLILVTGDMFRAQTLVKSILTDNGTKTGQINRELYKLAQEVRKNGELRALIEKDARQVLRCMDMFPEFSRQFREFVAHYGHRETTFDYYKPTWAEAPEVVLSLILVIAESNQDRPIDKEIQNRKRRVEAIQSVMSASPPDLHVFVHELIRLAGTFTWLDDLEHFETTRINLLVRRVIAAFGRRFHLDDEYDLFFLTKNELESLTTFDLPEEMRVAINSRKKAYQEATVTEPKWDLSTLAGGQSEPGGNELKGVPGSPGTTEGSVYLVRGVDDFPNVPQDAILVARTTNPSWTPLFYKCKGLITESGGPLSHGAVTARELGIPAVMFVRGALSILQNGDKVRIDGQRGLVSPISSSK